VTPIPEPRGGLMLGAGVTLLLWLARRRNARLGSTGLAA
jgi:hypothetical protein